MGARTKESPDAEAARLRNTDPKTARLGRYPFEAGIKYWVAKSEPYLAPSTLQEDSRKLRMFAKFFEEAKASGIIGTTDPRRFGELHISEFYIWMRRNGLAISTQVKYYNVLQSYLQVWGNRICRELKEKGSLRQPREHRNKQIRALSIDELRRIFRAADRMRGWSGIMIRGYMALAFGTACRPKEIILALDRDLDLEKRRFFVRHPKGEGSWAESQWLGIVREDMLQRLIRFREERAAFMAEKGIVSDYLFFNLRDGDHYSLHGFHRQKAVVERLSGVSFQLKDFRSSFASITISGDLSLLKAVSLQLRHSSVKTTEIYYAQICEAEEIDAALGDIWSRNPID